MAHFLHCIHSICLRKCDNVILALSWVLGLAAGVCVFSCGAFDLVSLMPQAVKSQPSMFGLLASATLPFLFSCVVVYLNAQGSLLCLCFVKAFLLAYVSSAVLAAFEGAGWLVRWLLLFTDICSAAVLYCFWHRHITGVRKLSRGTVAVYQAALCLIVWIDMSVISPLLRRCLL